MAKLLVIKFTELSGSGIYYCVEDEIEFSFKECVKRAGGSCLVELLEMTEEEYERLPITDEAGDFFRGSVGTDDELPATRPLLMIPRVQRGH